MNQSFPTRSVSHTYGASAAAGDSNEAIDPTSLATPLGSRPMASLELLAIASSLNTLDVSCFGKDGFRCNQFNHNPDARAAVLSCVKRQDGRQSTALCCSSSMGDRVDIVELTARCQLVRSALTADLNSPHVGDLPTRLMVSGCPVPAIYSGRRSHVANLASPLGDEVIRLVMSLRGLKRVFLSDGVIDAGEQNVLDELEGAAGNISAFHKRQVAAEHFVKAGVINDYARRNFKEAGFGIVDLDRERSRRNRSANIIAFPSRSSDGGPRAA